MPDCDLVIDAAGKIVLPGSGACSNGWIVMASGVPALIDALAVLDCEVIREMTVGQHSVFFCEVKNVRLQPDGRPLVHFNREFCAIEWFVSRNRLQRAAG